jgi:hypothetical protein
MGSGSGPWVSLWGLEGCSSDFHPNFFPLFSLSSYVNQSKDNQLIINHDYMRRVLAATSLLKYCVTAKNILIPFCG